MLVRSIIKKLPRCPPGTPGLAVYTLCLILLISFLPHVPVDSTQRFFLAGIGTIALWRYSWTALNTLRFYIYKNHTFSRWREQAIAGGSALMPSRIYIMMTIYRIEASTTARAIRAAIEEALNCGLPVTLIAAVVEAQDEILFKTIFQAYPHSDLVHLKIVRRTGSGKRDGLAQGLIAISRDMPASDALVVLMDGDTILTRGCLRQCAPFFRLRPKLGALTTDEISEVKGSTAMREWHNLRFAQRHILMCSNALSRRVMTLTGRMSIFSAPIATDPGFIEHIRSDHLNHWRLGKFRFLTGDDKSNLYWVMKEGYEQIYVPDVKVLTLEDPPSVNFFHASTQLMFRWFGNMLRTNMRMLRLGTGRMPIFTWWSFVDQRLSMWTTLSGPAFALLMTIKYDFGFFAYYLAWVGFVRWIMTLVLLTSRFETSWRYPFLLYYNQVYGSMIKTWVLFHLDRQSWTRQKTRLQRNLSRAGYRWARWSSYAVHATAILVLLCAAGMASNVLTIPNSAIHALSNYTLLP